MQLEEDLGDDLKWSMRVNEVLYSGKSEYQEVDLIDVGPFGKVNTLACVFVFPVYSPACLFSFSKDMPAGGTYTAKPVQLVPNCALQAFLKCAEPSQLLLC